MIQTALDVPDSPELAESCAVGFGVYVHVPFCASKCGYCDFSSYSGMHALMDHYVEAVEAEISSAGLKPATSVYIGGGTPTELSPRQVARLIEAIPRVADAEITVEANPESLDTEMAEAVIIAGANRVSLGMQSGVPKILKALGRVHSPMAVTNAVARAREAGFKRVNLDLILGAPGESEEDWRESLERALELRPEHISAYSLTVESGTPLANLVAQGVVIPPDDDCLAEKISIACDRLSSAGYRRYEVSSWALPGEACRQNLLYWGCGEYRGFGSSAHSHTSGQRFWNVDNPSEYVDRVFASARAGRRATAIENGEFISAETALADRVGLGLRRAAGIRAEVLCPEAIREAERLAESDLLKFESGRVVPTDRGLNLGLDLAARLLSV